MVNFYQKQWISFYVILCLVLNSGSLHAEPNLNANYGKCGYSLGTRRQSYYDKVNAYYRSLLAPIANRIIHFTKTDWIPNVEFYVSNEFDWFKGRRPTEPSDVVVGFGTNSTWDIAFARKAKKIIIADWNPQVIAVQELLVRPLLVEAKSPAEFFSFFAAVPLSERDKTLPLDSVLGKLINYRRDQSYISREERQQFINQILTRLRRRNDIGAEHIKFVSQYLSAILDLNIFKPSRHLNVGPLAFVEPQKPGRADLFFSFAQRYGPSALIHSGADPRKVMDPYFSVLSSVESLRWLQNLYSHGVEYAIVDVKDMSFYATVARKMLGQNLKGLTISTSNIFDCSGYGCDTTPLPETVRRFYWGLQRVLPEQDIGRVFVHHVEGTDLVHEYRIHELPKK